MSFYVISRPIGIRPAPGVTLTQGAIIRNLRVPRYARGPYHGLLITARCDVEHIRSDSLTFLPIVPINDWLTFDGALSVLLSEISKRRQSARKLMNQLDPTLERVIDIDDWEASFASFIERRSDLNRGVLNELKKTLVQYTTLRLEYVRCATDFDATQESLSGTGAFSDLYKRLWAQKVDELMSDKIFDAHFVPTVDVLESIETTAGYVVLFRYIVSVPGIIAPYLVNGVTAAKIQSDAELSGKLLEHCLDVSSGHPIGIVSNVTSPHLEYIIQRFTHVFSRIGSPDFTPEYRDQVRGACEVFR